MSSATSSACPIITCRISIMGCVIPPTRPWSNSPGYLQIHPLEIIACVNYHKAATSIKRERNPKRNAAQRRFWWQLYNQTVSKR